MSGTYDTSRQVLIRNRSRDSNPGWWLVTPLVSGDGTAVAVNRGWVPYNVDENGPLDQFAPPAGTVTVTGMVQATQNRVSGPYDPAEGQLHTLSRVDLTRLQQQVPYDLFPVYVNLASSSPAQAGNLPSPVPVPELGDGPHLNYAGQWFIFATLTLIVYPLLLRRRARERAAAKAEAAHAEAQDRPGATDPSGETPAGGDRPPVGVDT